MELIKCEAVKSNVADGDHNYILDTTECGHVAVIKIAYRIKD